jgi:DNA-binding transcriptional MerR regulator
MSAEDDASDLAYFRAVELIFNSIRGTPLLLTPADFDIIKRWRREGVPLDFVRAALELAFARREARGAKDRVNSLRRVSPAVDQAWAEGREMAAPGEPGAGAPVDVASRLARLVAALPENLAGRAELAARLAALGGNSEVVEQALAALDAELLAGAEAGLPAALAGEIGAAVERTVAALAGRLPADEIERARGRLRQQVLRQRLGLPILSLFSPDAEEPPPEEPAPPADP